MAKEISTTWKVIGGLVAILALIVALLQLFQSIQTSTAQDLAQSTQIVLLQEQLNVQHEIATLQAGSSSVGPTSTAIAQKIIELESTSVALATKEAQVKISPKSNITFEVQADTEWANTELAIRKGDTVDIEYISGKWRGTEYGYWSDGTRCSGSYASGLVPNTSGTALVARIGNGTPKCVGNSPFISSSSGTLYLSYNDCPGSGCFSDNEGSITVRVKVLE